MNNTMQYKGYVGSVEFSEADGLFFGKVLGIRAFANELRIMDHAPIPIDFSQFVQKEICHDTSERNRSARSL